MRDMDPQAVPRRWPGGLPAVRDLLDVVHQAVELPLRAHRGSAVERETAHALVMPDVRNRRLHGGGAPAVERSAPRRSGGHCLAHRALPVRHQFCSTLVRHGRLESALDLPLRGQHVQALVLPDGQAGEVGRTERGGLDHLGPHHGNAEQVGVVRRLW